MELATDHAEIAKQIGNQKALFLNARPGDGLINTIGSTICKLGLELFYVDQRYSVNDLFLRTSNGLLLATPMRYAEVIVFDRVVDPELLSLVYDIAENHAIEGHFIPRLKTVIVITPTTE